MRRAFEREAELLANLHHPALPNVIDHFTEGDGQFLVMQFISGEDLGETMELRGSPFNAEEVMRWADQLLDALDYLHTQEPPVLHRDIKPQNLKLTGRGQIILLDFGLAKGTAGQMSSIAASRSVLGFTPNFAPLEQIQGEGTDARSDLYSLAATLYYLMTGLKPPDALARASAMVRGQRDPLRPAYELNPEVPKRVARVLQSAMAQNPEERPRTAASMRDALRDAMQQARTPVAEKALPPTEVAGHEKGAATEQLLQPELKTVAPPQIETTPETWTKEAVQPTIASPVQRVSVPDKQKPLGFGKAQSDSSLPDSISLSKLGLAPATSELSRRKMKLWLGVGVVIAFIVVGILIAASAGLFSGVKRTANEPRAGTPLRDQMGMEFIYVPAGTFMMGSENGYDDEKPVHQVTIRNGFYMGKYEVTQAQWQQVMGRNSSSFKNCDQCPVEGVSWNDAFDFIKKLNAQNDGYTYRLPSEAEWEYACRAGTTGDYAGDPDAMAWYDKNSDSKTHPVGQKQANAFGLYDMYGNVWEWCEDVWHDSYNGAPTDGSAWISGGDSGFRVLRGGSWYDTAYGLRSADRFRTDLVIYNQYRGLRVVAVSRS